VTRAIPSEFAGFIRQTAVRAFDRLATRSAGLEAAPRAVMKSWSRLTDPQKESLIDELIAAAQSDDQQPPAPRSKRAVKRYDPEEVAATLPKKPKAKAKTKKTPKKKA
jgi:hypothetical protein